MADDDTTQTRKDDAVLGDGAVPVMRRLSTKLLLLTVAFVLIAEILIFPPSLANYRIQWLEQRLSTAAAVGVVLMETAPGELDRRLQEDVLMATGAIAIAVRDAGASRLLVVSQMPPAVNDHVDLETVGAVEAMSGAATTLFFGGERIIRVTGRPGNGGKEFELIVPDAKLRAAMFIYARNIALLSLLISVITAALVFTAIHKIMIRPIRDLRRSMLWFAAAPDDASRIIRPQDRLDEIGVAERELAAMQVQLHQTFGEQKHLADLGLAVSKINHDLRNILASAQLMSDRLRAMKDPKMEAFVPKLVRTLDRAVGYTQGVLSYGRALEPPPTRRRLRLRQLVEEVHGLLGVAEESGIEFAIDVEHDLEIDADAEQLFRVLTNLCRNAVQAMSGDGDLSVVKRLTVSAERAGSVGRILVSDTGPGLPPRARENLFAAFRGSARSGGTGLGLAIAHELVRAHGGTIELVESAGGRTVFSVTIPDQPVQLDAARQAMRRPA